MIKTKSIKYVRFGVLSEQQWEKFAVCEIDTPYVRGGSIENTPHDERLGILEKGKVCPVCGEINKNCPGHFGFIRLEEPVYHPDYIGACVNILKSICPRTGCCSLRMAKESLEWKGCLVYKNSDRLLAVANACKNIKVCRACKRALPEIKYKNKDGVANVTFNYELPEYITASVSSSASVSSASVSSGPVTSRHYKLSALACYEIFAGISDELFDLLGFNSGMAKDQVDAHAYENLRIRPESLILTVLPVLPMTSRPWVLQNSEKKDDDLTEKYNFILRLNKQIKKVREACQSPTANTKKMQTTLDKLTTELQLHTWMLFSTKDKSKTTTNRVYKGIKDRLSKKNGHVQMHVGGKRVDFNARTIIVSAGYLVPVGGIGCPRVIAEGVTEPEIVNNLNLEYMTKLLKENKINHVLRNGNIINVGMITRKGRRPFLYQGREGLVVGDIIERHLRDDDVGIFNRQPSLRIESMQGVRLKIFDNDLAFRLPLAMTRAYGADYDGDWLAGSSQH